jgi:ribonucleotide monophosphatase NagD (HAD superfamily)
MEAFDFPPGFAAEANNLAIDFDGVIHNANKGFFDGTCYGDPLPGALSALRDLSEKYRIVIFTAKAKPNRPLVNGKTGTELVSDWLERYGVLQYIAEITSEKPRAILYIDDNAYRFENWTDALEFTQSL